MKTSNIIGVINFETYALIPFFTYYGTCQRHTEFYLVGFEKS